MVDAAHSDLVQTFREYSDSRAQTMFDTTKYVYINKTGKQTTSEADRATLKETIALVKTILANKISTLEDLTTVSTALKLLKQEHEISSKPPSSSSKIAKFIEKKFGKKEKELKELDDIQKQMSARIDEKAKEALEKNSMESCETILTYLEGTKCEKEAFLRETKNEGVIERDELRRFVVENNTIKLKESENQNQIANLLKETMNGIKFFEKPGLSLLESAKKFDEANKKPSKEEKISAFKDFVNSMDEDKKKLLKRLMNFAAKVVQDQSKLPEDKRLDLNGVATCYAQNIFPLDTQDLIKDIDITKRLNSACCFLIENREAIFE
jgi:hypothetical protein